MKLVEVDIKQEMLLHMASDKLHSIKHKYTIECKNHILDGKVFYSETHTKKIDEFEYGKSKSVYYWSDKSKTYDNIVDFLKNEGVKLKSKK